MRIIGFLHNGWPNRLDKRFRDVYSMHQDLEEIDGCVLFQDRVIVPESVKDKVLKLLHSNHSGISKIKQLARRTVYWFGMNGDIERYVKSCGICSEMNAVPKPASYSRWIPTKKPFSRLHADFFYFERKIFLVVVDSFTKWIELEYMRNGTDHKKVIKVLLSIFARFGLPDVLVTDGGPPFNSDHFVKFFERQGVRVMKSPPYHPESNGQAERTVRLVKDVLKKFLLDHEIRRLDTDEQISYFLFNYRNICLENDGEFPSERLLSYKPKTLLDLINPKTNFKNNLTNSYDDNQTACNNKTEKKPDPFTNLEIGDLIYYRNPNKTDIRNWIPAKFLKHVSGHILQISLGGRILWAHKRQLKLQPNSRRKYSYVFRGESSPFVSTEATQQPPDISPQHDENAQRFEFDKSRKRRREYDEDSSDSSSSFYGFPADSFIFRDLHENETVFGNDCADTQQNPIRKSSRRTKKKIKKDYVYY